jgi:hypothetical protein
VIRAFAAGLVLALCFGSAPATAQGAEQQIAALDHVILVVPDLDSAAAPLARLGFRIKPGHRHPNNLINRHIKLRDGTGIELMALAGPPVDSMASRYAALLERGAGGAYVALRTGDLDAVRRAAERLGLPTRRGASGPWLFLGFPGPSDASAVFFTSGGAPANDPDSVTRHRNGALALAEAWVEGGPLLDSLLRELGARRSGEVERAEGRRGTRWELSSGSIVVSRSAPGAWPRPLGAMLARTRLAAVPISVHQLPSRFWIVLTNGDGDE